MSPIYLRRHLVPLLVGAALSPALPFPAYADPVALELCSPKADDHFEVTRPLFFWNSSPGAQKYDVYIDDAKVGDVPAAPIPVSHFGAAQPLSVGPHHWFIKAIPATGEATTSGTSAFYRRSSR